MNQQSFLFHQLIGIFFLTIFYCSFLSASDLEVTKLMFFENSLNESSGLASHGGFLWSINDGGNRNEVLKLSQAGDRINSIEITNAVNIDWESLAQDEEYLYVGDIGNNFNRRNIFTIYKVAWHLLDNNSAEAEIITFSYSNYKKGNFGSHNFDAEGIAIREQEIWLFTKNRGDGNTDLYRFPKIPGHYEPKKSQSLAVESLVTAADINPLTGALILLSTRRQEEGWVNILWSAPTTDSSVIWDSSRSINISPSDQWEGVLWKRSDGSIFLTHEKNTRGAAGLAILTSEALKFVE
tara:strand:+ start:2915 stop:3799 length:885 start_codon:yes stop_codon:yes gene_type:complete